MAGTESRKRNIASKGQVRLNDSHTTQSLFFMRRAYDNFFQKEDVGERLHHADVRRYTFQSSVGEHLSSLSLLRKHHDKNETGSADLVTGRSAVSLA
jgi:hypothetical protein